MSKIKKAAYLVTGVMGLALLGVAGYGAEKAQAACGYGVWANLPESEYSFYAPCDSGESEDGMIKVAVETINGIEILKITLNNYRGGGIYWECCATCAGTRWQKVVFELQGENVITEEKGIGINFDGAEFWGEGTLTIKALIPVARGGIYNDCSGAQDPVPVTGVDVEALERALGVTTLKIAGDGVTRNLDGDRVPLKTCEGEPADVDMLKCMDVDEESTLGYMGVGEDKCAEAVADLTLWQKVLMILGVVFCVAVPVGLIIWAVWYYLRKKAKTAPEMGERDIKQDKDGR